MIVKKNKKYEKEKKRLEKEGKERMGLFFF